ncbi:MAG TPA: glycosyltransferase family 2 protein [Thermoanaerobaculia bacterium]|nr:glycosyltransferase family 2 protein [Thermoanaerobaculia bacterium]
MNAPELSLVIPARDEAANLPLLLAEIGTALDRAPFEAIVVDDGSADGSAGILERLGREIGWLRPVLLERPAGQSAALAAGIRAAAGSAVATLDADLQNDPADLPGMWEIVRTGSADLVQGIRTERCDGRVRRAAEAVGRAARRAIVGDRTRDTGCATRVLTAELARRLPLDFDGMHRFVAAYASIVGARIVEVPVRHRPRRSGRSHYGLWERAAAGMHDALAVRWMRARYRAAAARGE